MVNYSTTELELLGLCVNISQFKHILEKVDSDCTMYHLALTYIMESKTKPASARIKGLLEALNAYSFYLFKGKGMILSKFLFRIKVENPTHMKSFPIPLTCTKYCKKNIIVKLGMEHRKQVLL